MSRFDGYEDSEFDNPQPLALWHQNLKRHIAGPKGQEWLRRTEAALVALPRPRLVAEAVAEVIRGNEEDEDGFFKPIDCDVCVLGAVMQTYGQFETLDEFLKTSLPNTGLRIDETEDEGCDADEVAEVAHSLTGINRDLAVHMEWLNDEVCGRMTPEERYAYLLHWVRLNQGVALADVVLKQPYST